MLEILDKSGRYDLTSGHIYLHKDKYNHNKYTFLWLQLTIHTQFGLENVS